MNRKSFQKNPNMNKGGIQGNAMVGVKAEDRADNKLEILRKQIADMDDATLITYLRQHHKSDVYVVLRDLIPQNRKNAINRSEEFGAELKQIQKQARESWDHDHAMARNLDVDKACTNVYTILLKMIRALSEENDVILAELNRMRAKDGLLPIDKDGNEITPEPTEEVVENGQQSDQDE